MLKVYSRANGGERHQTGLEAELINTQSLRVYFLSAQAFRVEEGLQDLIVLKMWDQIVIFLILWASLIKKGCVYTFGLLNISCSGNWYKESTSCVPHNSVQIHHFSLFKMSKYSETRWSPQSRPSGGTNGWFGVCCRYPPPNTFR